MAGTVIRSSRSRMVLVFRRLLARIFPSAGEVARFLLGGVLNTIVGYGCYLLLLRWMGYEMAYAIAYVTGIGISYVFSAAFVFRQPMRWRSAVHYPLVYLLQFLIGLLLLKVLIDLLHVPVWLAPLLVMVITIPLTFVLSRFVIHMK